MDSRIKELITQLRSKLLTYQKEINNIQGEVNTLKSQSSLDQATISKQKKELKALENKLFNCSESRKEIQGELDKKVVELENSNLTKEEVSQQVIQLLTKSGFTEVREKLLETWSNYAKSKDSLNELQETLSNSRLDSIRSIEKTKWSLWITVFVLLFVVVLLSLSLSLSLCYYLYKKKKKKNSREPSKDSP